MKFYEDGRLYPYRDAKKGYHSNRDLFLVYEAWKDAVPGKRNQEWDFYCDVRDGYAIGTNASARERHECSSKPDIGDVRYVKP